MPEPLVSAHIITYNHAPFIAQAIEGVLRQKTNFPFELVIGEDCSTDGTRQIVSNYQKRHEDIIRVITSDKNVGAHKNAYRTMKGCRGEYIAFCEGDDFWHVDDKLQKQVDYLRGHPECGMLFADCDVHDNISNTLARSVRCSEGFRSLLTLDIEKIVDQGRLGRWPWTCTAMVRRTLCEKVKESDPYLHQSDKFLLGDVQLWAELSLISKVVYLPESVATYRITDNSATHTSDIRKLLAFWISICEMKMYLCDKHRLSENLRKRVELLWFDKSLQLAFYQRNPELALEIRRKKGTFTWKEWLRYFGTKNAFINAAYRGTAFVRGKFRTNNPFS